MKCQHISNLNNITNELPSMHNITIFTPTYNRAYCLSVAYNSLCRQTCKNFEWLIIDDGSEDSTKELVEKWQKHADFCIKYVYKTNGGMHTAHNVAHANVKTELCLCLDSDDMLTDTCVEEILNFWNIYGSDRVAGIIADDGYFNGEILGTPLPDNLKQAKEGVLHEVLGVKGDKKLIFRNKVAQSVAPYPEFKGEKFGSMAFKRRLIEEKYEWLVYPHIIYLVEYKNDGATRNMFKLYRTSLQGWDVERKMAMVYSIKFKNKFRAAIHYISNSIFLKKTNFLSDSPNKLMTLAAIPFGIILNILIRLKTIK